MHGLDIVVLGLSITSSWGNGHAVTYRSLLREVSARGHRVRFLERNKPWYEANRDLPSPPYCATSLYSSVEELKDTWAESIRNADLVIVGSFVPDGIEVGSWVTSEAKNSAFYDIDTPVTLTAVGAGRCEYLDAPLIGKYGMYLSFTGGDILRRIETVYRSPMVRPLYCGVDPELYRPDDREPSFDLGYMGTWSRDRRPALEKLLLRAASDWPEGRFIVAGPLYPPDIEWPANVRRTEHISPEKHRAFYSDQRFTLNVTRSDMRIAGFSPGVRLFEAASCGTPIVSDYWKGLDQFFDLQREILVTRSPTETLEYLRKMPESTRRKIGKKARERVLTRHTASHRAETLETYALELLGGAGRKANVLT